MEPVRQVSFLLLVLSLGGASCLNFSCEALPASNLTVRTMVFNMTLTFTNTSGLYCNMSMDILGSCWPRSAAGEVVSRPCPEKLHGIYYNTTDLIYRECRPNGTWATWVNYSQCNEIMQKPSILQVHLQVTHIIGYIGHGISLAALVLAFVFFMRLRSIRCLRNIIHWNLISAFILRDATWFAVQQITSVADNNPVWCRLLTAAYKYFHVTTLFWMFGEGCYLHTAVVLTYSIDKLRRWMFLVIGWGIPLPIIVIWAIVRFYRANEKCWFGDGLHIDYIYHGPTILVLLINFIFLFNIVRILMTKLRASTTAETIQYRKAVKATLVLLPLLGITYMLFMNTTKDDNLSHIVFIYFNTILESFQGFFVSLFYCFLNGEVQSSLKKRYLRWQDQNSMRSRTIRVTSIPTSPSRGHTTVSGRRLKSDNKHFYEPFLVGGFSTCLFPRERLWLESSTVWF
ncbi:hypothetical protein WMY93_011896 [Mugilogobius chulae]|uniref:Corticotropin-releasing factor receptor 1 n=1 Tax=Mugilogobius chulae TaxID=88201 RepID=A0AAW0P441_9GOBI